MNHKNIFLTGLLSARLGGLEIGNLGNFAIVEPFIDNLKKEFPNHTIRTSFQLSESFEKHKAITCLRDERFWNYGKYTAKETIKDLLKLIVYKISFGKYIGILNSSKLLKEISSSDFVIDFSGDVFGENAKFNVFLEGAAKMFIAYALKKKVFILASSPGPFKKLYKRLLVKYLYNKAQIILNREPISTDLLIELGLKKKITQTSACPSYLFKGNPTDSELELLRKYGIQDKDKLVGFILTGWTLQNAPYNKLPRDNDELAIFADFLIHLYDTYNFKVALMSHGNTTLDNGELAYGNDYYILKQLYEMIPDKYKDRIFLFNELFDAKRAKAVIGNFDALISGRLHGAIAGISQCVPTIVYDYGHEPKAHKLRGFLRLINYEKFLCNPTDLDEMKGLFKHLWTNRAFISETLNKEVSNVQNKALLNFKSIKEYL
ncbi:polysaccharide pyruvyl transferase family protein [Carboxylicivirga taeanensis]|uniref:polysaccharide pyruvyl transferase family protein n=1 Tax=Carboxylicivirga taeanensis TaxID=1416875 RepID=UPI003F6E06B2